MIDSTTVLVPVSEEKALEIKFDITEAMISKLKDQYGDLVIVDKPSYDALVKAKMKVVHTRTAIDKRRKELGEKAQNFIKEVNEAAKSLSSLIEPIEADLKTKQKEWDDRQEAAKLEAERKERERVDGILTKINCLREKALILTGKDSSTLQTLLSEIRDTQVTEEIYMEFLSMTELVKSQVEGQIQEALIARLKWEEEEKNRREEIIKLEEMRKKIEAEKRVIEAEKARLEAEKREIEENRKREEEKRQQEYEFLSRTRESELKNIGAPFPSESLGSISQEQYSKIYLEHKVEWDERQEQLRIEKEEQDRKKREEFEKQAKIKAEREAAESLARQQKAEKAIAKKIEEERQRQEAFRPDKEKLLSFASLLLKIETPSLSDKRAKFIIKEANGMISNIVTFIQGEVRGL